MALLTAHAEQDTLGGGRFRQTIHVKRIAFRRDGNLRRIGNVLGNSGDPALSVGLDELAQFRVADKLAGQSPVLHFGKGASNVRLTPLATNSVNAVVVGNVVTYPGAWDNADLRLSIGGHILRKEILLRTGHPSAFAFRVANHAGLNIDSLSTPDFRILQPSLEGPNGEHIPLVWGISSSGGKYILTVTLPPGDYTGWVVDPTLALQPDAADGLDTYIRVYGGDASEANLNHGVTAVIYAGAGLGPPNLFRELVQFGLATVPAGAIVSSGLLQGDVTYRAAAVAYNIAAHRMLTQWWEGIRDGATPGAGEDGSTWNQRNNNGPVAWGAAGGQSGVDYAAVATATTAVTDVGWYSWDITADVVAWLGGTANYGVILINNEAATNSLKGIDSSDNATAENRPEATIEYTVPATGMSRAPIASWCH